LFDLSGKGAIFANVEKRNNAIIARNGWRHQSAEDEAIGCHEIGGLKATFMKPCK